MKMYKVYRFTQPEKDGSREILSFYCICVSFKCVQNIPKTLNRDSFSKSINAFCYHY